MLGKTIAVLAAAVALAVPAAAGPSHKEHAKDHAAHAKAVKKQSAKTHKHVSKASATKGKAAKAAVKDRAARGKVVKKVAAKDAVCPVMGSKVPANKLATAKRSVYKGVTYYFCCDSCKPEFDKNPAKYAKV